MQTMYEQFGLTESRGFQLSAELFLGLIRHCMCPNPNHPPHVKNPLAVEWLRENISILSPGLFTSPQHINESQFLFYLMGMIVDDPNMWGYYVENIAPLSDEEAIYNMILDFKRIQADSHGLTNQN